MNLYIVISVGIILSIAFHFIGVYANAKKLVWLVITLFWAGAINIAMSEIKPSGYEYIKEIKGKYPSVDKKIQASLPKISIYEMLTIKKLYIQEKENLQK